MTRRDWSKAALERAGLTGWHRFGDLRDHLKAIPREAGGVYLVYRTSKEVPKFLKKNPGGTWRGDPTVSLSVLRDNWVSNANVLYLGKANPNQLRNRLRAYCSFGEGGAGRHAGGRLLWQLPDAWDCLVAWRITASDEVPREVEQAMMRTFVADYGARPFANLVD